MEGFTYNQLRAALQSWPVEDNDEYTADLPKIIDMGELRLVRDLNMEIFDETASAIVVTSGSRFLTKPTGFIQTRTLWLITSGTKTPLLQRSRDFCNALAPTPATTGVPRYYCEYSATQWMVVPTPNATGTAESLFIKRPTGLASGTQNTWLGDNVGDVLFLACLMEAENWLKADDRFADIKGQYDEKLNIARAELRNSIRVGDYSPAKHAAKTVE
jgi:hypothetical protein